jgi:hypothetical protein
MRVFHEGLFNILKRPGRAGRVLRLTHSYAGINRIRFKGSVHRNAHISGKYRPLGLLNLLEWVESTTINPIVKLLCGTDSGMSERDCDETLQKLFVVDLQFIYCSAAY